MFADAYAFNQDVPAFTFTHDYLNMYGMFYHARAFSQNLTAWSGTIHKGTIIDDMFNLTACPIKLAPNLTAIPQGPFCYPVLK
jgi:hypothetical protein